MNKTRCLTWKGRWYNKDDLLPWLLMSTNNTPLCLWWSSWFGSIFDL